MKKVLDKVFKVWFNGLNVEVEIVARRSKGTYPNHYLLKKNRIKVLNAAGWKCEYCGLEAKMVHHKDCKKDNHSVENLAPCCFKCNSKIHQKASKVAQRWIAKYGMTKQEAIITLGMTLKEVSNLNKIGRLRNLVFQKEIEAILF